MRDNDLSKSTQIHYSSGGDKKMNRLKLLLLALLICLLAACTPSAQAVQTAIAKTQATLPTIAISNTPEPLSTSEPKYTKAPTKRPTNTATPQYEKTIDAAIIQIRDYLKLGVSDIDSITTLRKGNDSLEIELRTIWASKDRQPNVSFEAIQLLAITFANLREGQALNFVTGNPQHFSILLTTYSVDGNYKYSSLTYYDTLVKLYNKQITYSEWVNEAKAGFAN
jgi:ABC-type oligopeptide transport system substrate-binding subunit